MLSRETGDATQVAWVLDIQQVPLTRPDHQQVSVLICNETDCQLALGMVGHAVGLRNYVPNAQGNFREQVIDLDESSVYQQGNRKWFACPGISSRCGSKRMKLYLPPGATTFACADCHALTIPHAPGRAPRWKDIPLRLEVLHWHEPLELQKGA